MLKKEVEKLVGRFGTIFEKDKDYYVNDYGDRFKPTKDPETGKIKHHTQPQLGKYGKPFWFVGHEVNYRTHLQHLQQQGSSFENSFVDLGLIMPPTNEKGLAKFGGIDFDKYKSPEDIKRIVKQIYDEKLPLAPCYSKSGGLHVYMFTKELLSAEAIVGQLKYYNKYLKINAKEVNPKQTKLSWNEKKKKFNPGNGILLPYKSCIDLKRVEGETGGELVSVENEWIKNVKMETGTLLEFVEYAERIQVDQTFFDNLPLDLPEEKEEKKEEEITEEKINFSELKARPLSDKNPLYKILQNIKYKKEHDKGGTFDNHVVDLVYGAMESKMSDKHILEHLESVKKYSDKADDDDFFTDKIRNCRDKYDKANPGPLREEFMEDTIYILNAKTKRYFNKRTGKPYEKEPYDIKFAHLFPKSTSPTTYFKDHPQKQLAEEETYRPDLHKENDPLIKGADELYYLNSYKPGKIKPIRPETEGDIKPWITLTEHIAPIKEEREFLLDWLAHIVQKPWVKNRVIILIYTLLERMGKGSIFDTMTDILGETNAEPTDVKGVLDKGVTCAEKQLILVDECKSTGEYGEKRNLKNDLKKLASETRIRQRKLYVDYKVIETQTCYLVFTNEPDALQMDKQDQRFMVIKNENKRLDKKFYKDYHKWRKDKGSSYVYYMLKTRDLSKFDPNELAPMTKAKEEMQEDTGHPLTLKLREMLEEGRYPLTLETKIIGSTELADYITKHHKGNHVRYANDTKQLKRSLKEIGGVELGQILHKQLNYKPSLWAVRDQEEMLKLHKSKVCNEIWKPILNDTSPSEKHEEISTENFMKNQSNGADKFEKKFFETVCWSCHQPIDTDSNEKCLECDFAIKCACGKCVCDKPGSPVKKIGAYA